MCKSHKSPKFDGLNSAFWNYNQFDTAGDGPGGAGWGRWPHDHQGAESDLLDLAEEVEKYPQKWRILSIKNWEFIGC